MCVALVGCAASNKNINFPAVRVKPAEKVERDRIYGDRTTGNLMLAGAMFGIIGGVVGGGIAAASMSSGQHRFRHVTRHHSATIAAIIQKNAERALATIGKLPVSVGAPGEAELRLKTVNFGVSHPGRQRFAATVSATYELWDANGKRIFKGVKAAPSDIAWTRAEYEANPRLYADGVERAAELLGRQIAAEVVEELEYWLE
jgi:hypothetical protein